ncbi:tRNA (guanosine(37)-N1)-methyltransferase TrmD [bacterium]|nr:tRNA (guanosine(37)-N1)-methyltransferase TrmD [bacterium]
MKFHVLSVFPEFVASVFEYGVLRRAVAAGLIEPNVRDLRDWTEDVHRTTDDLPYGGGPGMVLLCEPVFKAVEELRRAYGELPLIYLSPAGERFTHATACALAESGDFILLCGRYEGLDQRVIDQLVDRELSIGDYVLSGGEVPAMAVIDAVARQIPGVVGNAESVPADSFATGILDHPHYTRPEVFRELAVPEVLLSGHHANIDKWRREQALLLTYRRRPELLSAEQLAAARRLLQD